MMSDCIAAVVDQAIKERDALIRRKTLLEVSAFVLRGVSLGKERWPRDYNREVAAALTELATMLVETADKL